jgi:RNA polymerase sigma-70 factor (ECF subfamily)
MLVVSENEQLPVRQARNGQAEAWDALFQRYQLPLFTYAFELLHDREAGLDVVQETFASAARHIKELREDDKFGSWLFSIAHQRCQQRWRKKRLDEVSMDSEGLDSADDAYSPSEWLIQQEDEAEFMKTLQLLSPIHRSAILLYFVEDFSLEEIAAITGASVGTVKSRLYYAKQAFKKLIQP